MHIFPFSIGLIRSQIFEGGKKIQYTDQFDGGDGWSASLDNPSSEKFYPAARTEANSKSAGDLKSAVRDTGKWLPNTKNSLSVGDNRIVDTGYGPAKAAPEVKTNAPAAPDTGTNKATVQPAIPPDTSPEVKAAAPVTAPVENGKPTREAWSTAYQKGQETGDWTDLRKLMPSMPSQAEREEQKVKTEYNSQKGDACEGRYSGLKKYVTDKSLEIKQYAKEKYGEDYRKFQDGITPNSFFDD